MSSLSHLKAKKATSVLAGVLTLSMVFSALIVVSPSLTLAVRAECSDGIDNDDDGRIDYPEDNDCNDLDDNAEGVSGGGVFVTITDGRLLASQGQSVVYQITLRQQRDDVRDIDLDVRFPAQMDIISASNGGRVLADSGIVRFDKVSVSRNQVRTLTIQAGIRHDVAKGTLLVARATAEGASATDTTRVDDEPEITGRFTASITDGEKYTQRGGRLYYTVRVHNGTNAHQTTDVRASLAPSLTFIEASDNGVRAASDDVIWRGVPFEPGQQRTFTFVALVEERVSDRLSLRARVTVQGASATDDTLVQYGLPDRVLSATIGDGRESAKRGDLLTYRIQIRNNSDHLGTEQYATASLPVYSEFVDVTEGGFWDGKNVRWQNLQIAPSGVRNLTFTIRVRSDAPLGSEMLATVQTDGGFDSDYTQVTREGGIATREPRPIFGGMNPSESTRGRSNLLLRKVASGDEAVPGSTVRYTLYVENVLDHPISNATIVDRFDARYLRFSFSDINGVYTGGNTMTIPVPSLAPGQSWQTTYVLDVSPNAPQGVTLTNIATIGGANVDDVPLTQRVRTVHTGVLTRMPKTGASLDLLASVLGAFLSLGMGSLQMWTRRFA